MNLNSKDMHFPVFFFLFWQHGLFKIFLEHYLLYIKNDVRVFCFFCFFLLIFENVVSVGYEQLMNSMSKMFRTEEQNLTLIGLYIQLWFKFQPLNSVVRLKECYISLPCFLFKVKYFKLCVTTCLLCKAL